jgi:hypothetical protein
MSDQQPPDGYVTLSEAVKRLGISDRTIRRRVQAGTIEGEYIARSQGTVLYVKLPEDAAVQAAPDVSATFDQKGTPTRQDAALVVSEALMLAQEAIGSLVERVTVLGAENAALSERVGRAEADAAHAARRAAEFQTERDLLRAELERIRARRWWQWW